MSMMQATWDIALGAAPEAKTLIRFQDQGQDCLWWALDASDVVVAAGAQARIWLGNKVHEAQLLQPRHRLQFLDKHDEDRRLNWLIQKIERRP
jgi:hypothetical protein